MAAGIAGGLPNPGRGRPGRSPLPFRAARGALLCLGAAAWLASGPALAAEWTLSGSIGERIEADTNRDLDPDPQAVYGSTTRFGFTAERATGVSELRFEAGLAAALFGGPGDTGELDRVDPSASASYAFDGPRVDFGVSADVDLSPASFAQIEETGITEGDATQLSVRLDADVAYAINGANRLVFAANGRMVRFTSGTTSLTETTSFGLDAGWEHDINRRLTLNAGLGVTVFSADNVEAARSVGVGFSGGARYRVSPRLSFAGDAGFEVTRTLRTIGGLREAETELGVTGSAEVEWRPEPDTTFVLTFSQGLEPSSLGELQRTTRLAFGASHRVTSWATFDLGLAYLRQSSGGGFEGNGTRRDLFTVSPTMAFVLTRHWSAQLGYTLRLESEDIPTTAGIAGGDAVSHLAFFEITRALEILP